MSKVFNQTMEDIANASGCDWDFVVDIYNHLWHKSDTEVDMLRFAAGMLKYDWSARGDQRFENVLVDLCEKSGYTYSFLFAMLANIIYDPDDLSDWDYFVGVTMEHDW